MEPGMQPLLRLPRGPDHRGGLARLPLLEIHTRLRPVPIAPRRLHRDMAALTIPRLRDRAESLGLVREALEALVAV